ncbi:uncharacterized protein LOC136081490 [Hydra vulgaris]|uniref:Uncharacterized protein LOC136081490 n=1 Tax=Hydra vulgaris TaxID=6087 RepID=A0ABM4C027_HYDVU
MRNFSSFFIFFIFICIINNKSGKYEFKIHRKNAITNIQVKATSNHDPQILNGIFKGFVHRAFNVCSQKHIENELKFLIQVFVENGYKQSNLIKIIKEIKRKNKKSLKTTKNNENVTSTYPTISLPWVPILSPKLRKVFRKTRYKTVFKSNLNLEAILTSRNKSKLQMNSHPGVYLIKCHCNKKYIGETKMQLKTRMQQHKNSTIRNKTERSALATHMRHCSQQINWDSCRTLKVDAKKFDRKVREAFEIQYHQCAPQQNSINLDEGQYVSTKFWTPFMAHLCQKKMKPSH